MIFTFNKFINSYSIQKLLILAMLFVLNSGYSTPPINPFITTWQTNTLTSVIIPLSGSGYDFTIDWGDGTTETKTGNLGRSITHLYATAGIKTVTITPNTVTGFPIFYMDNLGNCNTFLKTIAQWGGGQWSSMQRAFYGATTMDVTATDTPNLSNVTDFLYMFLNCSALTNANGSMANWTFTTDPTKNISMSTMFQSATLFNQNISAWNMTRVTNTSAMFYAASAFNQDISAWDVSNVTTMSNMFNSTKFNQNINTWNVANVTDMSAMFISTTAFNQPLNSWNVSKVNTMASMFQSSQAFNQDISAWNVSAVTNMSAMFQTSQLFNKDISSWDVSKVTNMSSMFYDAKVFNSPLNAWGIKTSKVTDMSSMFRSCPLFNKDINGWDVSSVINMQYMFLSANSFNQSLNLWVLTNLTNAFGMFQSNTVFNGDISNWRFTSDSAKSVNLTQMFYGTTLFNQNIGAWNMTRVTNTTSMFNSALAFNQDISAWDVSNVTTMSNMFNSSKFNQNISAWNVANVTDMSAMFANTTVYNQPLSTWNVSKVTNMTSMFQSSQAFNQDISAWNVSAVTTMGSMFYLASVFNKDISLWNVSNVTNMSSMFRQMPLYNQPLDAWGIKTSKVTNMQEMFRDSPVFNQPLNSWDMSKVTTTYLMFYKTNSFNQDLNSWNLSSLTNGTQMFQENTAFNGNIGNWQFSIDPNKNIDLSNMFNGTTKFNRDISTWNVIRVTNMSAMFINTSVFNQDLSAWDVSNVTNMSNMFNNAQVFNMPLNWGVKTAKVLNMSSMFQSTRLFNQDINGWNVSAVTNMSSMFVNNPVFNQNIGSWNVANVTNMGSMFQSALMFNQNIGNWNVAKVTNMTSMFENNPVFNQSLNSWNVNKVTAFTNMFRTTAVFNGDISAWQIGTTSAVGMQYMFLNAAKFNRNIGAWNVSKVNNMIGMLQGCVSFSQDLGNWDISSLTANFAADIFSGVKLCRANYNSILLGWSTLSAGETVVPSNLTNMNFGTSKYSNTTAVVAARLVLTGTKIWGITDGGVESDYTPPVISSSNSLAPNNTTIAVTFDSRVYNNCNGAGNIDVNDFVLSVSGGAAVLASPNPISITTVNNTTFTIGISYSTVANGSETLTISPAASSIFDLQGNDMATVQTSNTARLNDVTTPVITGPGPSVASTSNMSMNENILNVTTFTANETVTWSKSNANDGALFSLNASGVLTFIARPDYEVPTDADSNNTYIVSVIATDAFGLTTTQILTITINDVFDMPATFGNFDNVSKTVCDASYSISAPTSNNTTGAFTFTSSNTNVATISGTNVTIIAPGTTTITATQATDGYYIETTTTATLTIMANNTVGNASSTPTLCANSALTNITHATTEGTSIGTVTGLPAGVTAAWATNTITISGTPTASGTFNYSIPLTGGCGSVNATGTITVNPLPVISITLNGDACINKTTLSGTTGLTSYAWYKDNVLLSGVTSNSYSPTIAGNYSVQVSNGTCTNTSSSSTIYFCGVTADGKMASVDNSTSLVSTEGALNNGKGIDERGLIVAKPFVYGTVTTGTGRIWMDRNLGATRVAINSTDVQAYGDYYQWGRPADGHQTQYLTNNNSSGFTNTKSSTTVPPNGLWIVPTDTSNDWLVTPNNTLWTGANPATNPCPAGFRIPTEAEWEAERITWSSNNSAGAFASPLKLTRPGMLTGFGSSGATYTAKDNFGQYHTQTAYTNGGVRYFGIEPNNAWFDQNYYKSHGMSCRCIRD